MNQSILQGTLIDEQVELSMDDLCCACSITSEWIFELVEEGVIEPINPDQEQWVFTASSLGRAKTAARLKRDLNINTAGIALALDLLEQIQALEARLGQTSGFVDD